MPESDEITIRKILVALDTSPHGLAALEAAANLAAELRAELQGLFVEDVNLLRLAGLPFAREITLSSSAPRQLDAASMERTLRARAEEVRRCLASTADRVSVRWTFQVMRGHVTRATLEASAEADLLIMGREALLPKAGPAEARGEKPPIVVVYDGSPAGQRALRSTARLVRDHRNKVVVVIAASEGDDVEAMRRQCVDWFQSREIQAVVEDTVAREASGLTATIRRLQPGLLLVNRDNRLLDEATIDTLVNHLDCPVGLVR
jgi:nucleotide-binding universal stress UspA family protein